MALALNPNWLNSLDFLAWCKLMTGSTEEPIPLEEQAIRLSPRDAFTSNFCSRIGLVHLLQSQIDDAILWYEKARTSNPGVPFPHAYLAASYALKGEIDRASVELNEARRLAPRRSLFEHRPCKSHRDHRRAGILGCAENPRTVRSHLFRRPAQGRDAGGVSNLPHGRPSAVR